MERFGSSHRIQVFGVLLIIAASLARADSTKYVKDASCAARPTVVRVDERQDRYYPFFINLLRCGGSCSTHPRHQGCEPISEREFKIQVFDSFNNKDAQLTVTNHTKCKCKCVASFDSCRLDLETWDPANCRCKCRYPNGPPKDLACKPDFIWVRDICRCQCDKEPEICPPRKVWNVESCGCVCSKRVVKRCERKAKGLDYEKCECIDAQAVKRNSEENPNSRTLTALLVVLVILLVVIIICVLICCIRKRRKKSSNHEENSCPNCPQSLSNSGNTFNSSQITCDALNSDEKSKYKSSNGSINIEAATCNGIPKESTL